MTGPKRLTSTWSTSLVGLRGSVSKWDQRMLSLASHVSQWSRDPSTKVGAVIARPDHTIASLGFNGFPRKMGDTPDRYEDRDDKLSRTVHAEINAILTANEPLKGYTMYSSFCPCSSCSLSIIQAGVQRVVAPKPTEQQLSRWADSFAKTQEFFRETGVVYAEY